MLKGKYEGTVRYDDGTVHTFRATQHNVDETDEAMRNRILATFRQGEHAQKNPEILTLVRHPTAQQARERAASEQRLAAARAVHARAAEQQKQPDGGSPAGGARTEAQILAGESAAPKPTPAPAPLPPSPTPSQPNK